MKTYQEWEDAEVDLTEFIKPGDEIDYEIFEHIGYCMCGPNFDDGHFLQCGEAWSEEDGVYTYMTAEEKDGKCFYLGILPDMKKGTRRKAITKPVAKSLEVGDLVEVFDPGLIMLQQFMPKGAKPNNHGKVAEIWDNGKTILVDFPIGDDDPDEHSQVAPYPVSAVKLRK